MLELWQESFLPVNLFYSALLTIVFLYWITVLIGVLDLSIFDFDLDLDVEADVDIDVDVDTDIDADTSAGLNPALAFLAFFNLGKVPFMIFLSFLALFLWAGSVLGNHYLAQGIPYFHLAWIIPNLMISLSITKFMTAPLTSIFKDEENEFKTNQDIVGKIGTAALPIDDESISQLRVPTQSGSPLIIRVKASEGKQILKGYKALVLHYVEEEGLFIVEPFLEIS